jgi:hypothetical protein
MYVSLAAAVAAASAWIGNTGWFALAPLYFEHDTKWRAAVQSLTSRSKKLTYRCFTFHSVFIPFSS